MVFVDRAVLDAAAAKMEQYDDKTLSLPDCASFALMDQLGLDTAFAFDTEPDDEERHLAVLMRVRPMTARWLRPFVHRAVDEGEVVLLKGTHYRREAARRLPDPKEGLEFWELDLVETVRPNACSRRLPAES